MTNVESLIDQRKNLKILYKKSIENSKKDISKGENAAIGKDGFSDFLEMPVNEYQKIRKNVKYVQDFKNSYVNDDNDGVKVDKFERGADYAIAGVRYLNSIFNKWQNNDIYKSALYNVYIDLKEIKKKKESLDKIDDM